MFVFVARVIRREQKKKEKVMRCIRFVGLITVRVELQSLLTFEAHVILKLEDRGVDKRLIMDILLSIKSHNHTKNLKKKKRPKRVIIRKLRLVPSPLRPIAFDTTWQNSMCVSKNTVIE